MEPVVEAAQTALVDALALSFVTDFPEMIPERDGVLPTELERFRLNVVKSQRPPEILAEMMGLGEAEAVVDFVQTYNVEWIVHDDAADERRSWFGLGLAAIAEAVEDPTLGGVARGATIAPPDYENHHLATAPAVSAVVVPVRVVLRGRTLLG